MCHLQGITTNSDLIGKRSAAFEACKKLHMNGLLNDHLLPINEKRFFDIHKGDYLSNWDNAKYANGEFNAAHMKICENSHIIIFRMHALMRAHDACTGS